MPTATTLARLTLEKAINGYNQGIISQIEYEAFRRAWAKMQPNQESSYVKGWLQPSWDKNVELLAEEICREV